jgi:predicted dehydrogenase
MKKKMKFKDNDLKALVIGAGSIGRRHAQNLKTLGVNVTLFDINTELLARTCSQEGYTPCNNLELAISQDLFNFALVCTPNHLHIPIAQKVAEAGINIFIEKPLSHSFDGVQNLIDTVEKRGLCATVGFMLRFEPGLQYLKKIINPKDVSFAQVEGASYMPFWRPRVDYRTVYSAHKSMGGGVVLDAVHEMDYICWILGYPTKVYGAFGKFSAIEMDAEDIAMMIFKYDDKLVSVHSDYLQRKYTRRCKICNRDGYTFEWTFGDSVKEFTNEGEKVFSYKDSFTTNQLYIDEMRYFIDCIKSGVQPESTLKNGAEILKIALSVKSEE